MSRNLKRISLVGATALVASGLALTYAHAATDFGITIGVSDPTPTVGDPQTVTVQIINNAANPETLSALRVNGSCATTGNLTDPCPAGSGLNVLPLTNGTGSNACAGITFAVTAPDANGNQTVTPSGTVTLPAQNDNCTITFTGTVTGVPAGGGNANALVLATITDGVTSSTKNSAQVYTIGQAPVTIMSVPQPSNATVGTPIRDAVSLSGRQNGVDGTVLFNLFGPNDNTCTGPVVFTQSMLAGVSNSYTSNSFTPTLPGTYNWVVSYSGDANNAPAPASACGAEAVTITGSPVGTSTIAACNIEPGQPGFVLPPGFDHAIVGTPRSDRLEGGSGNDLIFGLGGNDRIEGGSGNDILCGGAGNDRIEGGSGADQISGGPGNDRIDGGSGADTIDAGGQPFDRVRYGSGN